MSLENLVATLYEEQPQRPLYHYTSLDGLLKIVPSKTLRATEIRYFNDSAEMRHTAELIDTVIVHEDTMGRLRDPFSFQLLGQFRKWINHRLTDGHMLFVACFTTEGNLLSQWRGYCPPGKGISLGFSPDTIRIACENQQPSFRLGKCIYERQQQLGAVTSILTSLVELAQKRGENGETAASQSFHHVFEEIESDLLRVAALLKDGAFREEQEWRAVSSIITSYMDARIEYREGSSTLVPFVGFKLPEGPSGGLDLNSVTIGPTPQRENSMNAVLRFLSKSDAYPRGGVSYCEVPYRTW